MANTDHGGKFCLNLTIYFESFFRRWFFPLPILRRHLTAFWVRATDKVYAYLISFTLKWDLFALLSVYLMGVFPSLPEILFHPFL